MGPHRWDRQCLPLWQSLCIPITVPPTCVWYSTSVLSCDWAAPSLKQVGQPLFIHSLVQSLTHSFIYLFTSKCLQSISSVPGSLKGTDTKPCPSGIHILWGSGVGVGRQTRKENCRVYSQIDAWTCPGHPVLLLSSLLLSDCSFNFSWGCYWRLACL